MSKQKRSPALLIVLVVGGLLALTCGLPNLAANFNAGAAFGGAFLGAFVAGGIGAVVGLVKGQRDKGRLFGPLPWQDYPRDAAKLCQRFLEENKA